MKTYALRKMPNNGYRVVIDMEVSQTRDGVRRYSHDMVGMEYKREEFAKQKAHSFVAAIYPNYDRKFLGVIETGDYTGEKA